LFARQERRCLDLLQVREPEARLVGVDTLQLGIEQGRPESVFDDRLDRLDGAGLVAVEHLLCRRACKGAGLGPADPVRRDVVRDEDFLSEIAAPEAKVTFRSSSPILEMATWVSFVPDVNKV
jgi:hypothetical protein